MAKSNKFDTVIISFVLDRLEPITIVQPTSLYERTESEHAMRIIVTSAVSDTILQMIIPVLAIIFLN